MKKSFLALWIGIVALLIFFWFYFPTLSRYRDMKIQEDGMRKEIHALDTKIKELKEERELLKHDPEYVEKVVREELGLVKPGEVVYKFVEEPLRPKIPDSPFVSPVKVLPGTEVAAKVVTASEVIRPAVEPVAIPKVLPVVSAEAPKVIRIPAKKAESIPSAQKSVDPRQETR